MKKITLILLIAILSSCSGLKNFYDIEITRTDGRVSMKRYKLPEEAKLSINSFGCLVYTIKDSACYCVKRNVINFKKIGW